MGQLKRQLVTWSAIAVTTAVLPGLALGDTVSPEHNGGRHGRDDRHGEAQLSVAGRAVSRGATDSYGLQIRGRSGDQATDAGGMVRFGHKGEGVAEGLMGEITCLTKDAAGVVTVTGTITRSAKRTKDGKGGKKAPGTPGAPNVPAPTAADDDTAFLDEVVPWDDGELAEPVRHGRDRDGKGEWGRGELAGKDFAFTIVVPAKPQKFSLPVIGDEGTVTACSGGGDLAEVTRGRFKTREAGAEEAKDDRGGRRGWWRR